MNAKLRSRIEMARRVLQFSRAHADQSPGYGTLVARLENRLIRCDALADQQLDGFRRVRAATVRKAGIRRELMSGHLRHLVRVARLAAAEVPELGTRIGFPPRNTSYLEFRTTARTIAAEAEAQREVLVRHGLVESVLEELNAALERFEQAIDSGVDARRGHVGASAELKGVVAELSAIVQALDGLNKARFAADRERLAAWRSASNIVDFVRGSPVPPVEDGGEVQPAA